MGCSMPGFPVLHCSLEFAQTHVHWVGDALQPSHPLTVSPFSSCLQSFLASESFLMSQLFTSGSHHSEAYTSFKRFHVQRTRCFAISNKLNQNIFLWYYHILLIINPDISCISFCFVFQRFQSRECVFTKCVQCWLNNMS